MPHSQQSESKLTKDPKWLRELFNPRYIANGTASDLRILEVGWRIDATQAAKLEAHSNTNPNDLPCRLALMTYYGRQSTVAAARKRFPHLLWMVQNRPKDYSWYWLTFYGKYTEAQAKEFRKQWLIQVKRFPKNNRVLGNAAHVLVGVDVPLALQLYQQARDLAPKMVRWTRELLDTYIHLSNHAPRKERKKWTQYAFAEADRLSSMICIDDLRGHLLRMATFALNQQENERGSSYCMQMLAHANGYIGPKFFANLMLGQIAIRQGRTKDALAYLERAHALTSETPGLWRPGHHFLSFLNDLLLAGEREIVIAHLIHFENSTRIESHRKDLKNWRKKIESGKTPILQFQVI